MFRRARTVLAAALLVAVPIPSQAALAPYIENFETLAAGDASALGNAGWIVFGNVYSSDHLQYDYGYGPYPAPNDGAAFCKIVGGEGGPQQGAQQLSVFNDYNNGDHALGNLIESNVYREQTIGAGDVGTTWTFAFDGKRGDLVRPSTAFAFIKTLNPAAGWATTNFVSINMTGLPDTWAHHEIGIVIDPGLIGQALQIGFVSTTTHYLPSGVVYDNLSFLPVSPLGVGDDGRATALDLRPNVPNPFSSFTRLDFSIPRRGLVDVSVYDVAGRRVATLTHGDAEAGSHVVIWNGRLEDGSAAPAGLYLGVLRTPSGRVTRSMVLAR